MATGWVKSLHCKSMSRDDVYDPKSSLPKKPLLPLSSCSSSTSINDVIFLFPPKPPPAPRRCKPPPSPHRKPKPKSKPKPNIPPASPTAAPPPPPQFPTLTELPAGHSSRRVVEIIFNSSWSPRAAPTIEILFRVHSPVRTLASFEAHRDTVRSVSGGDARCAVDGNEMMRFYCSPSPAGGGDAAIYDAGLSSCPIRTFAGSGDAHEAVGGGVGRRSMLLCRVIAGRVRSKGEPEKEGESVTGGPGELLVFDRRAVLPCFLIIYQV